MRQGLAVFSVVLGALAALPAGAAQSDARLNLAKTEITRNERADNSAICQQDRCKLSSLEGNVVQNDQIAKAGAAASPAGQIEQEQPVSGGAVTSASSSAVRVTSATRTFSAGLSGELERIAASHDGVMGISLKNLDTGEEVSINGAERFPTASTIKLAVMTTVFDRLASGVGPFRSYYDTREYDPASSASGAGFVRQFRPGTKVELKELLHFMITVSDNTATNMLVEWLGGLEPVNGWLAAHGFAITRMHSTIGGKIVADSQGRSEWGLGVTTPDEMRRLLEMLATGRAGTTSTSDEMLRLLGHQYFDGVIASQTPPTVWVGSKSGSINESRSDLAIVASPGGTYVLSVYTKENRDQSWTRANAAERAIRSVARAVWRHYNPSSAWTAPSGVEEF